MKKIGLIGGSFDPIHNGHISLALTALDQYKLDQVKFIPLNTSFCKPNLNPYHHRQKMLKLALKDYPHFQVSYWEKNGDSVFTNTLNKIESLIKSKPDFYQFYFIMGDDTYKQINTWKNLKRILQLSKIIVVNRNHISSSQIRQRINRNLSVKSLIPAPLLSYISQHNLY